MANTEPAQTEASRVRDTMSVTSLERTAAPDNEELSSKPAARESSSSTDSEASKDEPPHAPAERVAGAAPSGSTHNEEEYTSDADDSQEVHAAAASSKQVLPYCHGFESLFGTELHSYISELLPSSRPDSSVSRPSCSCPAPSALIRPLRED